MMLSNEELRRAIDDSFCQWRGLAQVDPQRPMIQEHINALRAEQLRRAREKEEGKL